MSMHNSGVARWGGDGARGGKTNKRIEFESNRKRIGSKFCGFGFDSFIKRIFSSIRLIHLI